MPRLKHAFRIFALLLPLAGCMPMAQPEPTGDGGTHATGMVDMAGGASSNPDALPASGRSFPEPCDNNAQCASMLCTKDSYDRSPTAICTYKCDPAATSNPQCPNGCNMKGYCRLPK